MPALRIVQVGGQEADQEALEAMFRDVGLSDVRRTSAADALEALRAREADMLLVDVTLPANDILALLQAAASADDPAGRVPVIVSGPAAASERIQACLQRGAEDFLITPVDPKNPLLVTRRIALSVQRRQLARNVKERPATNGAETNGNGAGAQIEISEDASRFVPREFIEHLDRKSFADVQLGDHVLRAMTVFFSNIRDFTMLSDMLSPQQCFDFLNSYLKNVNPIIRNRNGFVDKYMDDAIMALFPGDPGDAIQAGLDLQQQVVKYNRGRRMAGYVQIQIGIGMHRGELILGTIGESERMQTTVIADAVNLASRIEGLTKTFGVGLLVSASIVEGLTPGHEFKLRNLGAVKAKGKTQSVELYECYNNDAEDLREHKDKWAEAFAAGMGEFRRGMFLTAGRIFTKIAELHPGDAPAAYYRDRCTLTAVAERGPGVWDGAESIQVK